MTTSLKVALGKAALAALIRDEHGNPRLSDPNNIPEPLYKMLTEEDLANLKKQGYTPKMKPYVEILKEREAAERKEKLRLEAAAKAKTDRPIKEKASTGA